MLTPETLLNERYRIVGLVGQGGMGAVYEAVDERLRAPVALKQTMVAGETLSRAFEHEAQLLAGLRHAALPRVIDHFVTAEGQFLVMEFIAGEDLGAALRARGAPFPLAQVLTWADQLLDALDYLHGQSPPVIHRDIKPQNLKQTPRGEVVLLDFGLAKGSAALPTRAPTEAAASLFGYTPQYAPLEQVQGAGTDPRSDLYSLGATLYHLLTGVIPADTLSRATEVLNGRPDPLRPAHELSPAVPAPVGGALAMAMALKADARFGSARAMRNALRQAAADAPAAAVGPTVVARQAAAGPQAAVGPTLHARPEAAAPAPQARPALPALPTGAAGAEAPAQARRPAPPPERRGLPAPLIIGVGLVLLVLGGLWLAFGRGGGAPVAVAPTAAPAPAATADPREQATAPAPAGAAGASLPEATAVAVDASAVRPVEGAIDAPGEQDAYSFEAAAGQQVYVWTASHDDGMEQIRLRLLDANGDELQATCLGCGDMGVQELRAGGRYTLVVGSDSDPATGAYELRLNLLPPPLVFDSAPDVRIAEGGPVAGAGTVMLPGAKTVLRFEAAAGQQVYVRAAAHDEGMEQIRLRLLDANGDELQATCLGCGDMGVQELRAGGAYSLEIGADTVPATGDYDVRVSTVPPQLAFTVGLPFAVAEGRPGPEAGLIAAPGAKQAFTFEAQPGQQIFVRTVGYDEGMEQIGLRLLDANGDELKATCLGCGDMGAQALRAGGRYTLVVGADTAPATGAYQIEVTTIP